MAQKPRGFPVGVWALPLLICLYVLSVGPAVRLADHAGASVTQALELVYSPLIWAHGHTPLRRPLEFYLRLWEK